MNLLDDILSFSVPKEWRLVKLKDYFDFYNGMSLPRNQLNDSGEMMCLHYGDIHTNNQLTSFNTELDESWLPRVDLDLSKLKEGVLLDNGDVVFADASEDYDGIGKSIVVENPGNELFIAGLHTIVAKDKTDLIDLDYKRYFLKPIFVRRQFRRIAAGSSVFGISKDEISEFMFLLPSKEEQKKIAAILQNIDTLINEIAYKIAHLSSLKRALAKKVLTQGIGHTEFKETEIGQLPLSWKVISINELSEKIVGGGTPSRDVKEYFEGNIPWATVKDMDDSMKKSTTTEYITDLAVHNSSARVIDANNIIVSTRMGLGRGFINTVNMAINQDLKGIFLKKDIVLTEYFLYYYKFLATKIESMGKGSTVKGIVLDELKKISVAIPDIQEQKKIVQILSSVDGMITSYQQQKLDYTQLKAGLMQQLLTGKIRVKCDN